MEPISQDSQESAPPAAQQAWTTAELTRDFDVQGFLAPLVLVKRRSDGVAGTLEFKHSPRVYFDWKPL